jgi:hypothetical protein
VIVELPEIVIEPRVRGLCCRPYPLHPKGCPNFNHKDGCPPKRPIFDLKGPYFAIINEFDMARHVERMKALHPEWSDRQLRCCLYWQAGARKKRDEEVKAFTFQKPEYKCDPCPEAAGVNVTETLKKVGIELEWPPEKIARQVVIAGIAADEGKGV